REPALAARVPSILSCDRVVAVLTVAENRIVEPGAGDELELALERGLVGEEEQPALALARVRRPVGDAAPQEPVRLDPGRGDVARRMVAQVRLADVRRLGAHHAERVRGEAEVVVARLVDPERRIVALRRDRERRAARPPAEALRG